MFDLTECNPSQRKAIVFGEGPLLLLAGPGSGKTFTITKRLLYLLQEKKVAPEEILVITFTKEAAISMKQRFAQSSPLSNTVNFGTFHSVFYHILLQSGSVQPGNILNDRQKINLIFPILKKIKEQQNVTGTELPEVAKSFLTAIAFYKNTGEKDTALKKIPQEWQEYFPQGYRAYEEMRRKENGLDFDDMLKECEELLQKNAIQREYWQKRFSHILIDEFQDINYRQYSIVRILAEKHRNVFAVGDDDQAIYGFRGAKPDCMRMFEQEFGAERLLLETNYRSRQEIVEASLSVINENRNRFPKQLVACEANRRQKGQREQGVIIREFREAPEQLQYLITQIKKQPPGESCAVLFRTNLSMQGVAARLTREGIPYLMKEKAQNLYQHFIVLDIMAYLRIAQGTAEREDYLRIMNKPFRGISREAFGKEVSLEGAEIYYSRQLLENGDRNFRKPCEALRLLKRQLQFVKETDLKMAVLFLRKACGYEAWLQQKARLEQGEKTEEWLGILEWITEDAGHYNKLREWQEAQAAYERMLQGKEQYTVHEEKEKNCVRLLTVHAAKGLEFDHVWIPDCNEKMFPHGNLPDPEQCEEERRIFYVAMTRAKKDLELLCLTGTRERPRFPSRFLIPLNHYRR